MLDERVCVCGGDETGHLRIICWRRVLTGRERGRSIKRVYNVVSRD